MKTTTKLFDSKRTGLVIFDMLNCFIHPSDRDLEMRIAKTGVVSRCAEILQEVRRAGIPIFYATVSGRPDGTDYGRIITDADMELNPWPDGPRLMAKPRAVEGSNLSKVIDEIAPNSNDYVIPKHRWSAFAGTHLDILLRDLGIDTILLAGGSTDVGDCFYSLRRQRFRVQHDYSFETRANPSGQELMTSVWIDSFLAWLA